MPDTSGARFHFRTRGLELEFAGREDFVSSQIAHMWDGLLRSAAAPQITAPQTAVAAPAPLPAPAAESAAPAASAAPSLEEFYRRAKSRDGRGAIQETILLFAYFLRRHRGKEEFGIDNLNACFSLVGVTPPRSLANTLGIMKRNLKLFQSGSRRGTYTLTDKGTAYVKRLIGNV